MFHLECSNLASESNRRYNVIMGNAKPDAPDVKKVVVILVEPPEDALDVVRHVAIRSSALQKVLQMQSRKLSLYGNNTQAPR